MVVVWIIVVSSGWKYKFGMTAEYFKKPEPDYQLGCTDFRATETQDQAAIAFTRALRRLLIRAALFLWIKPFPAALSITGCALA